MTTAVDVNEAFRTERLGQIATARESAARAEASAAERAADFDQRVADGKMRDLGGGRFQVTDPGSWDNGEVLRLTVVDGQRMIMPEHGLDTSTGQVALYTRVPAWHELGTVIPDGLTDVDDVLVAAGLNFEVIGRPILYRDGEGNLLEHPTQVLNVRDDTWASLKAVSKTYKRFQNRMSFAFLQKLVEDHGVTWESAGALAGGARTFVCMRLPRDLRIDAAGINDEIVAFLATINSFDGSSRFRVVVTPWRPLCGNTERFAVRDAFTSWSMAHSGDPERKIEEARRTLRLSIAYFDQFAVEEEQLAQTPMSLDAFLRLASDLIEMPAEPTERQQKTVNERRDSMAELYRTNCETLGATAYAAERAVTEWVDWKSTVAGEKTLRGPNLAVRATRMLEGEYDELKTRAHQKLMLRVRG